MKKTLTKLSFVLFLLTALASTNKAFAQAPKLSALSTSEGTLSPAFDPDVTDYTVVVDNDVESIVISAESDGRITVNHNVDYAEPVLLPVGTTTISVITDATDEDENFVYTQYNITVTRQQSNDATLSGLSLSSGSLSPDFAAGTAGYTATVASDVASITVTPVLNSPDATATVNGTAIASGAASESVPLNFGENTITIAVTAQNGDVKTYTVVVTREKSNDATLSGLSLSSGSLSPDFAAGTAGYTATVASDVASITVTPVLNSPDATATVNGTAIASGAASESVPLNFGENTITIAVTAQNGDVKTYTVVVTREKSNDATLSGLSLSSGSLSPDFAAGTAGYTATVASDVASITVTANINSAHATATVNGTAVASGATSDEIPLNFGENTITIAVTAQNGDVNTYTVVVTREKSSDATLSSLSLSSGSLSPDFAAGTVGYTATVGSEVASITVTANINSAHATATVNGTAVTSGATSDEIPLNFGENTITIAVTAQNGDVKTYTVVVTREKSSDNLLSGLSLSSGSLSPEFEAGTAGYTATVASGVSGITVTSIVSEEHATLTVNGTAIASGATSDEIPLNFGENTITIAVTAQNGDVNTYTVVVTREKSSDATLSGLSLSSGSLSPDFETGTVGYTATVGSGVSGITVTSIVSEEHAILTVNGTAIASGATSDEIPLNFGENTITIAVTAQNGDVNTYTVVVTREKSSDATLSSLSLSSGSLSPDFETGTAGYTATVASEVASITVTANINSAHATATVNGTAVASGATSDEIPLNFGENTITIAVTAQNGDVKMYTVLVTREKSNDATLSGLSLSSGSLSPDFAAGTAGYTATVASDVASITVTPVINSPHATATVNGTAIASSAASDEIPLNFGENTITIDVTAQNGDVKTYSVVVTREKSNDATLSGLSLSSGSLSPDFAAGTTGYTATVGSEVAGITVTPIVNEEHAILTVNGTAIASGATSDEIPLNFGENTITINVTAQNGDVKTYTVLVTREKSSDNLLSGLSLSSGSLSPDFEAGTAGYTATVGSEVASITVTPVINSPDATATVNDTAVASGAASDEIPLDFGENTITIAVTAQNGDVKTYTVLVTREKSSDNLLAGLSLSSGSLSPDFEAGIAGYTATVGSEVASITVTPVINSPDATATVNDTAVASGAASDEIPLDFGENTITIAVTAQKRRC
jgi:HSP20 family molecular chaperone IbpA